MAIGSVLAQHVFRTTFADLPSPAITAAKRSLVDTLAVAWAARSAPGVLESARGSMAGQEGASSTLWHAGSKASVRSAAFVNSVAASALDFDSVHPAAAHADIVSVPVALAVGEAAACSGKEVLTAVALCSDLICRLALASGANSGWFYGSLYGVSAAAAITAKLRGASADAIESAMGLGFLNASGTYQAVVERSLSKRTLAAFAADSGVLCGDVASAGISGPREWIEGRFGLYEMYERGEEGATIDNLGVTYHNVETTLKPYPTCQANHAPIDAMLALRRQARLEDIETIEVVLSPYMDRLVGAPYEPGENPQVSAQFNVRYSLACALVHARLGIEDIRDDAPLARNLLMWAGRVRVVVDAANKNNYCPATVRLALRDGRVLSHTATVLRGGVDAPLSDGQMVEKLRVCLEAGGYRAPPKQVNAVYEALMLLEHASDAAVWMRDLMKLVQS